MTTLSEQIGLLLTEMDWLLENKTRVDTREEDNQNILDRIREYWPDIREILKARKDEEDNEDD